MKLYYSGASSFGNAQTKASLSLGGWISNTPIPNSLAGNIFGDISLMTIEKKLAEYKLIVIKNELLVNVTDVILYFIYPENYPFVKYSFSPVAPNGGTNGEYYFETIDSINQSPLYVETWYEADGLGNALNIGGLQAGRYIGLWLKREILPAVDNYYTDDAMVVNYKSATPIEIPKTDLTQLKLSWT